MKKMEHVLKTEGWDPAAKTDIYISQSPLYPNIALAMLHLLSDLKWAIIRFAFCLLLSVFSGSSSR